MSEQGNQAKGAAASGEEVAAQRKVPWLLIAGIALLLMFGLNALYTGSVTGVALVGILVGLALLAFGLLRRT